MEIWWGPKSPQRGLKRMEKIRTSLVCETWLKEIQQEDDWELFRKPYGSRKEAKVCDEEVLLKGAKVCDVGCGGGTLTEALAELGAQVTGLDIEPEAIAIGRQRWESSNIQDCDQKEYIGDLVENFSAERAQLYDVSVCSNVLERVTDTDRFMDYYCRLVRPGRCLVITTINRTLLALLYSILFAEDLMGFTPHHLHRHHVCVKPEEVDEACRRNGLMVGMVRCVRLDRHFYWETSDITAASYCMIATLS